MRTTSIVVRRIRWIILLPFLHVCMSLSVSMEGDASESACPMTIPVIDLSPWTSMSLASPQTKKVWSTQREAVVEQVQRACQDIGFFAVRNHAVESRILDRAWNASWYFFDLPLTEKMQAATNNQTEYPYGYEQSETLEKGKALDQIGKSTVVSHEALADLKETFAIGPSNPASGMPPRRFPPSLQHEFQLALEDYYASMETLAALLLEIFAEALDLTPSFFKDKFDHHMCALRLLNYPTINSGDTHHLLPGQLRAGAHSDYGALTILKSGGPGLQVLQEEKWVDVPYLQDAFVINLGDLMQRWTNDKWVSTLHRVVVPPHDRNVDNRRQSVAFFVNMNSDARIEPIASCVDDKHPAKFPPISAGEHLMAKHLASMGQREDTEATNMLDAVGDEL